MSNGFSDLPWHDAVVLELFVDRRQPGKVDQVVVSIRWPDERRSRITFTDCYALDAKLNFGIVATEAVLWAVELQESDALGEIRQRWSRLGVDLSSLKCFRIETSSTASTINVYAHSWSIGPLEPDNERT
jgi:hypothetical protein